MSFMCISTDSFFVLCELAQRRLLLFVLYPRLLLLLLNGFHPLPRGRAAIAPGVVDFHLFFAVGGVFHHNGDAVLASVVPLRSRRGALPSSGDGLLAPADFDRRCFFLRFAVAFFVARIHVEIWLERLSRVIRWFGEQVPLFVRRPCDVVQVAVATSHDRPALFYSTASRKLPSLPLPSPEICLPFEKGLFPETLLVELPLSKLPSPKVFFFPPPPCAIVCESSLVESVVVGVAWMVSEDVVRVMIIKHDECNLPVVA